MISIRNARNAKKGLRDMIGYIGETSEMTVVEIGSYVGDSTRIFAENFGKVICIDPWVNGYDDSDAASYQYDMEIIETQFDLLLEEFDNIAKFKGRSLDIVHGIADGVIDVVYIDGLHTYEGVKADIPAWLPKLKQGGFLCGHDYQSKFQGVIDAVNEFKTPDMTFGDTSWVIKI